MATQSGIWSVKQVRNSKAVAQYSTGVEIGGISGNIYAGIPSSLTINGLNFGGASVVRFGYGGSIEDVSVTPNSDTQISVAVPSDVYNNAVGTSISIAIIAAGEISAATNTTIIDSPTGGTITVVSGYIYHTFTSSSNFVIPSGMSLTADTLVVAGGGGAGYDYSGGGGAGGYISTTSVSISAGTYPAVIGLGGAYSTSTTGSNGQNSTFNGQTAIGGGGGGRGGSSSTVGASGGSGGGGAWGKAGGPGTSGQGNSGGNSTTGTNNSTAGGGGGKGSSGQTGVAGVKSGDGGSGEQWLDGNYYAGGGGGGGFTATYNVLNGLGGQGGGGDGGYTSQGSNGTANTGGGGGGAVGGPGLGGNGGSGIVIVRYAIPS